MPCHSHPPFFPSVSFYFNFIFEGTIPSGSLFLHALPMCQTIGLYPARNVLSTAVSSTSSYAPSSISLVSHFALTPTLPVLALPCLRRRSWVVTLLQDN